MHVASLGYDYSHVREANEQGLPMLLQMVAHVSGLQYQLSEFNLLDFMPNWVQPLVGSAQERAAKLKAPGVREAMKKDVEEWPDGRTDWGRVKVLEVVHERNYKYEGRFIKNIAEAENRHPVDVYLDLALDEDLETSFEMPPRNNEESLQAQQKILLEPFVHISVSDGGAHTRFSTTTTWPLYWLATWIRDREIMTLEQAHYKASALPAWLASFNDRGTLRVGNWADVIVYNQAELGFEYDRPRFANDFPGGERRLIQKPTGFRHTIVNGTVTFNGNDCTDALPGKLLRSHQMVG